MSNLVRLEYLKEESSDLVLLGHLRELTSIFIQKVWFTGVTKCPGEKMYPPPHMCPYCGGYTSHIVYRQLELFPLGTTEGVSTGASPAKRDPASRSEA